MRWIERAQIDYSDMYMRLYVAYNAWFRQVTQTTFDREAISRLKKRFVIWNDYCRGQTLQNMTPVVKDIATLTKSRTNTLVVHSHWRGIVEDEMDWQNLIHFWYQVRCDLFHGNNTAGGDEYVRLAYLSLNIFMLEIRHRMNQCFSANDLTRLNELNALLDIPSIATKEMDIKRQILHQKYIRSHDIWKVDLIRL